MSLTRLELPRILFRDLSSMKDSFFTSISLFFEENFFTFFERRFVSDILGNIGRVIWPCHLGRDLTRDLSLGVGFGCDFSFFRWKI